MPEQMIPAGRPDSPHGDAPPDRGNTLFPFRYILNETPRVK